MKLSITPVALAVTMALGAAVAQAQTLPSYGTTAPSALSGLYLAVWDNNTKATELVNLTSTYANVEYSAGSSVLTTPTVGSNGWTSVSNFDGYSSVDQLNLGTISGFNSVFSTSSQSAATQYAILGAPSSEAGAVFSQATGASNPLTNTGVPVVAAAIIGEISNWKAAGNTSPIVDQTGSVAFNATLAGAPLDDGALGVAGDNFGTEVGSAANFFNDVGSAHVTYGSTEYTYDGSAGFWLLSSTGDLTWNLITSSASTVPLPPAVWLFASGLIGLCLIGRRREGHLGAAA